MKDFILRNKVFLGIVLTTILLLFGGIYLFSKNSGPSSPAPKVSDEILIPQGSYKFTSATTPLMLVEFGDYQCPACGAYHPIVKKLLSDFSGKLNFVFRDFPLSQHANAPIASYAVLAAGLQGKYWEMHDKIYETQSDWSNSGDAKNIFIGYAKDLGLNGEKFKQDLDSSGVKESVQKGVNDGNLLKVNATPTFYLNGQKIALAASFDAFKKQIENALEGTLTSNEQNQAFHAHFDLKVYVSGSLIDLSLSKYQSSEKVELDPDIHLHDGNGKVVHLHKVGVPLSQLFNSLKIVFPKDTANANLKVYVNGNLNEKGLSYVPEDLDKVLVSFGPKNDVNIAKELTSVSDDACIYSLKCPERGTPPPESCAGGLGTGCQD